MRTTIPLALAALLAGPAVASDTTAVLTAIDSKTISDASNTNWNDNRLRAYWSNVSQGFVDGFCKFDFSSIPNDATITSMSLRTFHEQGFGNPANAPTVRLYRTDDDSWSRGAIDSHGGLNEVLTPIDPGPFPSGDQTPYDWPIDVAAVDWSTDLADDAFSLVMRNENGAQQIYSYVYWHGADTSPAPPQLTVRYTTGPTIKVDNFIAAQPATLTFSNFTPNGQAALLIGGSVGPLVIPNACGVQTYEVGLPLILFFVPIGPNGSILLSGPVPSDLTGFTIHFQALDVPSCEQSNPLAETAG